MDRIVRIAGSLSNTGHGAFVLLVGMWMDVLGYTLLLMFVPAWVAFHCLVMAVSFCTKLALKDLVTLATTFWKARRSSGKTTKDLAIDRLINEQTRQRSISRWVIRCQSQRRHAEEMFQSFHPNAPADILTSVTAAARAWIDLSEQSPRARMRTCRQIILLACPQHKVRFAPAQVRTYSPSASTQPLSTRSRSSSQSSNATAPSMPGSPRFRRWRSRSASSSSSLSSASSLMSELPFTATLTPLTRPLFLELAISLLPTPLELLSDPSTNAHSTSSPRPFRLSHYSMLDFVRLFDQLSPLIQVTCTLHWLALLDRLFGAATPSTAHPLSPGSVTLKSPPLRRHSRSPSFDSTTSDVRVPAHPLLTFATCAINTFPRVQMPVTVAPDHNPLAGLAAARTGLGQVSETQFLDATRLVQVAISHEQFVRQEEKFESGLLNLVLDAVLRWKEELEWCKRRLRTRIAT
ncbi:hypothetical protein OIV83_003764 [Microbotryomycetes sp. JL201]|nr:hypothetical protein OIV83_003764 [Microbotryomycetes sp. JL201]